MTIEKKKKNKWQIGFKLYLCMCGRCFWSHKHFTEHLKDTRRWRQYHYTPTSSEMPFIIHLVHKSGKNINEAFTNRK